MQDDANASSTSAVSASAERSVDNLRRRESARTAHACTRSVVIDTVQPPSNDAARAVTGAIALATATIVMVKTVEIAVDFKVNFMTAAP